MYGTLLYCTVLYCTVAAAAAAAVAAVAAVAAAGAASLSPRDYARPSAKERRNHWTKCRGSLEALPVKQCTGDI